MNQDNSHNKESLQSQPIMNYQENPQNDSKDKEATTLCISSLIAYFFPNIIAILVSFFQSATGNTFFSGIASILNGISFLVAWVLMIIVRVKYPQNAFGKVLMWVYIGFLLMGLIAFIVIIVACKILIDKYGHCTGW